MADKRIDAHTNTTTVADVDEFIVDSGSNGTRNITYSNLKSQILGSTSIATIGNSVTEAIYNTYTDIGDLTQTGVTGATVAAQISQLNDDLTLEKFTVTLASSIGTPQIFDENNFYNPKTKMVHLSVTIYSPDALIPVANATIFTVPKKYRPAYTVQLSIATVCNNDSFAPLAERCYLSSAGNFCLNNFIYGNKPARIVSVNADYISA